MFEVLSKHTYSVINQQQAMQNTEIGCRIGCNVPSLIYFTWGLFLCQHPLLYRDTFGQQGLIFYHAAKIT